MNSPENQKTNYTDSNGCSVDAIASQLFKELVLWQTQIAMMFLGQIPNPQTGQYQKDTDQAQVAIGILEMLEQKTRGNLSPDEEKLLRDCLTQVRLAYLEVVSGKK